MTKLADRRTRLRFETSSEVRRRPLVVEVRPRYLIIKLKGLRRTLTLDWETIYDCAAKMEARRVLAEKTASKKGRSK
jgi:hypothetical protein